tara:strand:+ start:50 stop:472 length:423 start_codon:yes stop_codon:yes gene_type:complete
VIRIIFPQGLFMSNETFMPHGHCYLWKPEIVWLNVIPDVIIVLSYFSIPFLLVYVVHKTKGQLPFNWVFLSFAIFILACGTTHLMEIVNIWQARYYLAGIIKVITAVASMTTAALMVPLLPKIIAVLQKAEKSDERQTFS